MDTILFIDDQQFELDEVKSVHPSIEIINAAFYSNLLENERLNPRFITEDSVNRRKMYLEDILRNVEENDYKGTPESFLRGLNMKFIISEAKEEDLKRAEELFFLSCSSSSSLYC